MNPPSPEGEGSRFALQAVRQIPIYLGRCATSATASAKAAQAAAQADWVPVRIPPPKFVSLGGIGASTKLFPALTLGCGAVGGSSSSNNISPLDLINIRRVAWDNEQMPAVEHKVDNDLVELLTAKILERLK